MGINKKTLKTFLAIKIFLIAMSSIAMASPPAVKFERGALVSPSIANTYYGIEDTHTNRLCEILPGSEFCEIDYRATHLKELARTLGKARLTNAEYTRNVYEYVYMNIETEFRYGLSKGALGALLDQSGTPFDQASLMVELLRENGISASYVAGSVTLTADQFSKWSGFYTTLDEPTQTTTLLKNSACQFLADGGIPANCNGSTNLSSITLNTLWVSSGGNMFNPSLKTHILKNGTDNLTTAMGCGSTCGQNMITAALSGKVHTDNIGKYAQFVNENSMSSLLDNYATNLESHIKLNMPNARLIDIIGGKEIPLYSNIPMPGPIFPYNTVTHHTWSGEIPDQYRTRVGLKVGTIDLSDTTGSTSSETDDALFADEIFGHPLQMLIWPTASIYAQRLMLMKFTRGSTTSPVEYEIEGTLYRENERAEIIGSDDAALSADVTNGEIKVDHPYASNNGSYMDSQLFRDVLQDADRPARYSIVTGFGNSGTGLVAFANKQSKYNFGFGLDHTEYSSPFIDGLSYYSVQTAVTEMLRKDEMSELRFADWLVQSTQIRSIINNVSRTHTSQHHAIGFSFAPFMLSPYQGYREQYSVVWQDVANQQRLPKTWAGPQIIDVESGTSTTSPSDDLNREKSAKQSQAVMMSALEGSVIEQATNGWLGGSVPSYLSIANSKQHRFYHVTSANLTQFNASNQNYDTRSQGILNAYQNDPEGYNLIAPIDGHIGTLTGGIVEDRFYFAPLIAFTNSGNRIAYVTSLGHKGASGGANLTPEFEQKELTFEKYKSDLFNHNIDLQTGGITVNFPNVFVSGQGSFPEALAFSYTYKPNSSGYIKNNFEVSARFSTEGTLPLAQSTDLGINASHVIASALTLDSLNETYNFESILTAAFLADKTTDRFHSNVVTVDLVNSQSKFFRRMDGNYYPLSNDNSSVTLSALPVQRHDLWGFRTIYAFTDLTYRSNEKVEIQFSPYINLFDVVNLAPATVDAFRNQNAFNGNEYIPHSWEFPTGIRIDYGYDKKLPNPYEAEAYWVTEIRNTIGRKLTYHYRPPSPGFPDFGLGRPKLQYITGEAGPDPRKFAPTNTGFIQPNGRRVSMGHANYEDFGNPGESGFAVRFYTGVTDVIDSNPPLNWNPLEGPPPTQDPGNLMLEFILDRLERATAVKDANDIETAFYPANVSSERFGRGETVDAMDNSSVTYFNNIGQPLIVIEPSYEEVD